MNLKKKKKIQLNKKKKDMDCVCVSETLWIVCAETISEMSSQLHPQRSDHAYDTRRRRSTERTTHPREGRREEGRWECNICGKCYNRSDSLAHHRSIHRGDTVCPICRTVFTRKYTMRCHMVNIHGVK